MFRPVTHFRANSCPYSLAYADEHWEMGKVLERKELMLKNLMNNDKGMRALAKYIAKTRRMKVDLYA